MTGRPALAWPGRRRGLGRTALLFGVTAGAFWPIWLAQVLPAPEAGARSARGRVALVVAALVPVVNIVLEVVVALVLPRTVRRLAERQPGSPAPDTEAQAFLLLAAPLAGIVIALVTGLPVWLAGYLAWPLEAPGTLLVQRSLNRLEPSAPPAPRRTDGETVVSALIGAAIVITVTVLLVAAGGGDERKPASPLREQPAEQVSDVATTSRSVWITRITDDQVQELSPRTLRPTGRRVKVGRSPYDLANGYGSLWVADYRSDSVSRVDPRSARTEGGPIATGRGPFGVAVGFGRVWVTNEVDRNVVAIDPRTGRVTKKVTVGLGPRGVDVGHGSVWVAGALSSSVVRVDPGTGAKKRIPMPALCQDVAVGAGSVWAAIPQANAVVRIDPDRGRRVGGIISVGPGPASVDYGRGSVWVANSDGTVTRIDARTGRVAGKPRLVGGRLTDLTVDGRYVWVLRSDGVVRRITAP